MGLYQGLWWDHLPWPRGLTCRHPSGSHAAITWGWPQHMFVYPGIKWVCGDFAGSALHCPALKFRYPQSSHKGTADGMGSAPWCCPVTVSYPGHELLQAPRTWVTSGESTVLLTVPLHFLRVFCIPKGFMVKGDRVGTQVWVPRFLGTWTSVVSCSAVLQWWKKRTPCQAMPVHE